MRVSAQLSCGCTAAALLALVLFSSVARMAEGGTLGLFIRDAVLADEDPWPLKGSDPYIRARIVGHSPSPHSTSVKSNNNRPTFNEEIGWPNYNSVPPDATIRIKAIDVDDVNADDDLGSSEHTLDLAGACDVVEYDYTFTGLRRDGYVNTRISYTPVNECLQLPCGPVATSTCTCLGDKSHECGCVTGYERVNDACVPINNCAAGNDPCDPTSTVCRYDGPGLHTCTCRDNYEAMEGSSTHCQPVNVCDDTPDICGSHSICEYDGPGRYDCSCETNHTSPTGEDCLPINPCLSFNGGCDDMLEVCIYTGPNQHRCACAEGAVVGESGCELPNPCDTVSCGDNSECFNLGGGEHECKCVSGYASETETNCMPIDRCALTPMVCGSNSICNTTGPDVYTCSCEEGYGSSTGAFCQPINQCFDETDNCGNSTCVATGPGTYDCLCPVNHESPTNDGLNCEPINPCATDNGDCGPAETTLCTYLGPALRNCSCLDGYVSSSNTFCTAITTTASPNTAGSRTIIEGLQPAAAWTLVGLAILFVIVIICIIIYCVRKRSRRPELNLSVVSKTGEPSTELRNPMFSHHAAVSLPPNEYDSLDRSQGDQPMYADIDPAELTNGGNHGEYDLPNFGGPSATIITNPQYRSAPSFDAAEESYNGESYLEVGEAASES